MDKSPLRRTKQRDAITQLLGANPAFYSAQDIHDNLLRTETQVGLSTIYRCLNLMVAADEVDVVVLEDGQCLYRLCGTTHHHHIRCTRCGTAVEITIEKLESFTDELAKAHGFTDIEHTIEISGLCKKCAKAK